MDGAEFSGVAEALEAVRRDFAARPSAAMPCTLGDDLKLIRPEGEHAQSPAFYVLGFNGGAVKLATDGRNKPADRYDRICARAAEAVGANTWILAERCLWGSPHAGQIEALIGKPAMRELLKLHARANRALFRKLPPFLIWAPGVSTYLKEAVDDYDLTPVDVGEVRRPNRREVLWRHYVSANGGASFLFTKHPAARPSHSEQEAIFAKLAALAPAARAQAAEAG